jgi:hypothetical protein
MARALIEFNTPAVDELEYRQVQTTQVHFICFKLPTFQLDISRLAGPYFNRISPQSSIMKQQ